MKLLVVESPGIVKPLRSVLERYERDKWRFVGNGGPWQIPPPMKDGCAFEDGIDVGDCFGELRILDASKKKALDRLGEAIASADETLLRQTQVAKARRPHGTFANTSISRARIAFSSPPFAIRTSSMRSKTRVG